MILYRNLASLFADQHADHVAPVDHADPVDLVSHHVDLADRALQVDVAQALAHLQVILYQFVSRQDVDHLQFLRFFLFVRHVIHHVFQFAIHAHQNNLAFHAILLR